MAKGMGRNSVRPGRRRVAISVAEFTALKESVQDLRDELRLQFKRIAQIQVELDALKQAPNKRTDS